MEAIENDNGQGSTPLVGENQKTSSFLEMIDGSRHLLCKIRQRKSLHSLEDNSWFCGWNNISFTQLWSTILQAYEHPLYRESYGSLGNKHKVQKGYLANTKPYFLETSSKDSTN